MAGEGGVVFWDVVRGGEGIGERGGHLFSRKGAEMEGA